MKNDRKVFCLILFVLFIVFLYRSVSYYAKDMVISDNSNIFTMQNIGLVEENVDNDEEINQNQEKMNVKFLKEEYQNDDIRAILRIKGTSYEQVIPQSDNNKFYLKKGLNKKYDVNGTPFLDYRVNVNNSRKLLIYGHNSSKIDMSFKILENYYDENYFKKHPYLELETEEGIKTYEIFSVYVETKDYSYYNKVTFSNDDDFIKHVMYLKDKSFYDTGVMVSKTDNILILQTCSTMSKYKNLKKKFMLIISKEIDYEKIY